MRQRKKFKLFLIVTTICAISLFKTIESIRVPTDWSEIIPTKNPQQKSKLPKQKIVYTHPKQQHANQQNVYKSQKPFVRYTRILQRPQYNPIIYKTIPLNPQNLYAPKRIHAPNNVRLNQQSGQSWVPLTTINQKYNLAPILTQVPNSYSNYPPVRNENSYQHEPSARSENQKEPFIWVPYQKTQITAFNTPTPLIVKNIPQQTETRQEPEAYTPESINEPETESYETAEPPTRIPNFAEKIYANDPFSTEYVEKDGLESRSDNNEKEDPENYKVPQDETPVSEHEIPLDIPTKPVYPGEGEWAKAGRKYRVFKRPEVPSKQIEHDEERPDGYETFENGQDRFKQAQSKYEQKREDLADKFTEENGDDESEPLYEKPEIGFVPLKTYAQVRKTETVRHLPQSEAYKEALSEEELINAPRLREVVKNTRAHTVYTEEGYEDEAYDHAGKVKKAEENDGFVNLEDDFEDYKEKRKKMKKGKYNEEARNTQGVDNESRLSHEDIEDTNEDQNLNEEYLKVEGDSNSSGTEFKQTKRKPRKKNRKANTDKAWSKSEIMKNTKETILTDMSDGKINMEVRQEIKMIKNPGTRGAKKFKQIQTKKISHPVKSGKPKNLNEIPSTTIKSSTETINLITTELIPNDKSDILDDVNNAFDKIGTESETVITTTLPNIENKQPRLRKKLVQKVKISEINHPTGPTLTRVKRYDREKLSKIYIRKRPKYYWERSKNRGNIKIEFTPNVEKSPSNTNQNNTKGIKEPIPIIKPISKLAYKNRPKRDAKQFQIDHPKLNIDELVYDIVDVSKIQLPTPKPDLTFIKYPYYLMAESGRINKHSPLKYAEDMRSIPDKSEGGMEFYESTSSIQCPEVETTVEPIPDRIKNKDGEENSDSNEDNIDEKIQPVKQIQRLKGLGDKIDCMKVKYFGENPLDSPFFNEEIIEAPSMESVFPQKYKKQIFTKQPIKANLNSEETKEQISYIQQIAKNTAAPKLLNTQELVDNMQVIVDYLSDNIKNSSKKVLKRDTTSIDTNHSFKLDTIVVLDEESTPNIDGDMKKLIVVTKSENHTPEPTTDQKEHRTVSEDDIPEISELILTTTENQEKLTTTTTTTIPPPTTTESIITTRKVLVPKRRRRPLVSTKSSQERKPHYSEQHPEDFVIIIDTAGESLSDIPLQLPLVNNKEFGKTFDINQYLPQFDFKAPEVVHNLETKSLDSKQPNNVQMEVFADILQHMKTSTNPPQTTVKSTNSSPTDDTIEKPVLTESEQKSKPVKRRIRKPNRKIRMKVSNSSLPPPGQETVFSKPEPIYNDQPTSETINYSIYNDQPTSGTENYSVREAIEVADLNRPSPKFKYPGTYKTLYLQDNDETNRDIFTPDHYEDVPEYSSNPDHSESTYEYPPTISDEFKEISNPNDETYTSKYSVQEVENENSLQYDLVFNRIHNSYVLRPVKHRQYHHSQYNSGFQPIPNYNQEFKPIDENQEEILVQGLKPVRYQNGLKLIIPHYKMPKQVIEQFQTISIRPVRKLKPLRIIRLGVTPKKVIRIKTKQPLRLITPQQVPVPIPLTIPHRFSYRKHNTQQTDYFNIRGMVPPLVTEHNIGYSDYQPVTFSRNNNFPYDSLADENTNLLARKSFMDLQMESSDRMETVVDINGKPITPPQRIYTELDRSNRQANQYKKMEDMELMEGEVLVSSKDSHSSPSSDVETDVNLTGQKSDDSLKDSYGNIIDKPILSAYSAVVVEMANESKKYINESHEPNMNIENKTETTDNAETTTIISFDSRRGEPKYENKIQNHRIRFPSGGNTELPITNRRRYKHTSPNPAENPELGILRTINSPELFDINHYIPDSKLMRELRRNNTLFTKRKSSNLKPEAAESQPRHSYSSRFNSADEQLPLATEKTLQKPVILVIEQIIKPNNESKPQTLQTLRKSRYQKSRKIEETTTNSPEITTTTQRIVSFRRVRPIPIVRTSSSIVTSDITESTIRKSNRPRTSQFTKFYTKSTDPVSDQKEHIINRSRVNKTIRTNINNAPRQKLVVDPVVLRQKARAEAQAEAMEKVKEKLESNVDKNLESHDAQNKSTHLEEDSKVLAENPTNNHYEKNEHRHTTSEIIHTKIYSPQNDDSEDDIENDPEDDEDEEDNEHDETLSKDYSEQVEIIGNLEQIRNGPKHGGNYRHIHDQKSDDTNHDDRRNRDIEFEDTEDDSEDEGSLKYSSYDRDFSESKIKTKSEKSDESIVDDFTSAFYSDPNLPKKINNLKHEDLTEDRSEKNTPPKVVKITKDENKPSAYWSKIIKDPGMRQYFYVRE